MGRRAEVLGGGKETKGKGNRKAASETTKGNDTVFEITFDGLYRKCKETDDKKEREHQTLSVSAHPNTRRKIDF